MLDNLKGRVYTLIMSKVTKEISMYDWVQIGVARGWVSEPFCNTHDGDAYMSEEEEREWEEGGDPCQPVMKLLNQF